MLNSLGINTNSSKTIKNITNKNNNITFNAYFLARPSGICAGWSINDQRRAPTIGWAIFGWESWIDDII